MHIRKVGLKVGLKQAKVFVIFALKNIKDIWVWTEKVVRGTEPGILNTNVLEVKFLWPSPQGNLKFLWPSPFGKVRKNLPSPPLPGPPGHLNNEHYLREVIVILWGGQVDYFRRLNWPSSIVTVNTLDHWSSWPPWGSYWPSRSRSASKVVRLTTQGG